MNIKLYHMPGTRSDRVHWLLEELGLDYELALINLFSGEANTVSYKAIHPLGRLPAIEVDGKAMFESGGICSWLTDAHPQKKLAPAINSDERREYEQWMYFVPGEVEPPLFYHQLHNKILPDKNKVKEIIPWLLDRYMNVLETLNQHLTDRKYLLGDHFSTADIMLGSTIDWLPDLLEPHAALQDYLSGLYTRESYIAALKSHF